MTILYADDDPEDHEFFADAVREINPAINLLVARHGKEILSMLEEKSIRPDVIFLDINMPVMGGKDCLINLKSSDDLKDIPVIMCTTTSNKNELDKYLALGAKDYIIKENSFQSMRAELKKKLAQL